MEEKDIFGKPIKIFSFADDELSLFVDSNQVVFINNKPVGNLVGELEEFKNLVLDLGVILVAPYRPIVAPYAISWN